MGTLENNKTQFASANTVNTRHNLEDILLMGYRRAATSFSMMIGSTVRISNKKIDMVNDHKVFKAALADREHLILIVTSIIGTLRGESYLLLTAAEERVICEMCRKAFGGGNSVNNELMLKEIDNIISAAVITEFSNRLSLRIYGDVPQLFHSSDRTLWNNAARFDEGKDYFIMANASFEFEGHAPVSPSFIWRFDKELIQLVE